MSRRSSLLGRSALVAVLAAATVLPARAVRAQGVGIAVGSHAPSAVVHTLDGQSVDLGRIAGKGPALIEFWATWCPNCRELEPTLKAVAAKYASRVRFVGVAVSVNESPARVRLFVQKHGLPGEQYFDTQGAATGAYDVPATSFVVVLDAAGKVVYTGQGGDQNLDAAIKKAL